MRGDKAMMIGDETPRAISSRLSDRGRHIEVTFDYDRIHLSLDVKVVFRGEDVIERKIFLPSAGNIESFVERLEEEVEALASEFGRAIIGARCGMKGIDIIESEFSLDDWHLGTCKYSSVGHTKYCYLAFTGSLIHTQWTRLYFRLGEIDMDKTTNYEKNRSDQITPSTVTGTPPAVMWMHEKYDEMATKMIEENKEAIVEKAKALPLNKEGMREDYDWKNAAIMIKAGNILRPCHTGDMADPHKELMIGVFHSGNKKVLGFAIPISGGRPVRVVSSTTEYGHTEKTDPGSILKGYMHAGSRYKLGDNVHRKDEYIQVVMNDILEEWKEEQ